MSDPLDRPLVEIQYRPDLNILTARWQRDASLAELQQAHHAVLAAGLEHHTFNWLMDRRRFTPSAAIAQWVAQQWLPAVAQAAAPPLRLASLISPELWQFISSQDGFKQAAATVTADHQPYLVKIFIDEGEAVRWLTHP